MAEKKTVTIELQAKTDKATDDVKKLNKELNNTSKYSKDASDSLNNASTSLDNSSDSAKKLASSFEEVKDNGGAIAVLDSLTGGLATRVRDAYEATKLFNFSLEGTKKALIATGVGALVVLLGTVVAYWDDITNLIEGVNRKLKFQEENLQEQLKTQTLQLDLLKQQIAIEELRNGFSPKLTAEYKKQLLIQREQNIALLENLQTQLDIEESKNKEVTLWEKAKIAASGQLGFGFQLEQIVKATNKNSEKSIEIQEKLNEAKKKTGEIDLTLAQIDKDAADRKKESQDKAKETEKQNSDKKLKDEKEKADAIERIRKGLIDTEDERRKEELRKIKLNYDEQIKLAEKYYGEESQKVLDLREAQKNALNEQQLKFDEQDKKKAEEKSRIASEKLVLEKENDLLSFEEQRALIKEREELLKNDETINDKDRLKLKEQFSKAKIKISDLETKAEKKRVADTSNALNQLSDIVGKNTVVGKGLAVAAATINTYQGVTDALAAKTITPFETALKFINAGAILSNGLKTVKQITSVKIPNASGGSGSGGASAPSGGSISAPPQPPAFNVVGASDTNQLADAIGSQTQQPQRAYVVSNDVTTAQSMDRNIVDGASI